MKKIIFLDFDGVLNTEKYQTRLREEGKPRWDDYGQLFDPEAVANLKMVIDTVPDALLVINSSWKLEGLDRVKELWKTRCLPGIIHSCTPDYVPDLMNINFENYDIIAMLAGKGNDVKQWMDKNVSEGCQYVIFDDMPSFFPDQKEHLICTDPRFGITAMDAMRAIEILTNI